MKSPLSTLPTALFILATAIPLSTLAAPGWGSLALLGAAAAGGADRESACHQHYETCDDCTVTWRSVWDEAGLRRYRFTFNGTTLIKNSGQDFLSRIRCHDGNGVANNWGCWDNKDGTWTFDVSEVDGAGGSDIFNKAISDVVGKSQRIPG